MSASDWAAWWGAITATIVLGWDVYKWRQSKSNIRVSASPNMQTVNHATGRLESDKNICVEVVNNGDKLTTLTHLVVIHYANWLDRIRRKPSMQGVVTNPLGGRIPYELEPGKRWTGLIDQKDIEEKTPNIVHLYCGVYHSASNKAKLARVKLK